MRTLHWFREDLRISDNTALYHAAQQATEGCLSVYFITPTTWQQHDIAACRVDFILRGLRELSKELASLNIPLLILECETFADIPTLLLKTCQQYKIQFVHFNQQYEFNERKRDEAVIHLLEKNNIHTQGHHDQTIIPPNVIRTQKGETFTIFTPFKKAWIKYYQEHPITLLQQPKKQLSMIANTSTIPATIKNFNSLVASDIWLAGENAAQKRLRYFVDNIIAHYKKWRDFPAIDGTSKLSPYLATGMISPRQCLQAALEFNQKKLDSGNEGAIQWISELIWREFYKDILLNFPRVSKHQPFKLITNKLQWDNNPTYFEAWKQGKTGFPFVDAAMRQLQQTGWMHNRLRMLVAMFFTKQLWLDWRQGEQFFMQHLIDGDLSANNGGWQWSASTGTDAVPYFRIFNPITQSERFDPEGKFIRQYCPELSELDNKSIHDPYARGDVFLSCLNYPKPIIDYKMSRERVLKEYKALT
jgi:deoxyribodipyrimidine photo-lyase